jgi:hypothetical protein
VKQAQRQAGPFPAKAQALQSDLEVIARNLKLNYPNLRIAYFSSRTRSYSETGLSPEPTAYEGGFAVKWMIEKHISGAMPGTPWLSWGPYLWSDGLVPRSDGFTWACEDLVDDFTHPSTTGRAKVADQLLAFFKTDATAASWFLKPAQGAPAVQVNPSSAVIAAGDSLRLSATAQDPDGVREFAWTFDDGTFAYGAEVTKVFRVPGTFNVRLAVADSLGNTALSSVAVQVGSPAPVLSTPRVRSGPNARDASGRYHLPVPDPFAPPRDARGRLTLPR